MKEHNFNFSDFSDEQILDGFNDFINIIAHMAVNHSGNEEKYLNASCDYLKSARDLFEHYKNEREKEHKIQ